jgi:hypothetical protein
MVRAPAWVLGVALVVTAACGARPRSGMEETEGQELRTRTPVTFRVTPVAGPGSKGPHSLAPESTPALEEVRAALETRPALRLRVECAVNPMTMGATPDPAWGERLARQVTDWLVARGVDCRRLEPAGRLADAAAPAETVRFLVAGRGRAGGDACKDE